MGGAPIASTLWPVPVARRRTDYMDLDAIQPADRNPKDHDDDLIEASIGRFGFMELPVLDERTGKLVAGHGRIADLRRRRDAGEKPPDGITVKAGHWLAPVVRGWSSRSDDEAHAAGIALNRVGEKGGWKADELYEMLDQWAQADPDALIGLGFDVTDLDDLVAQMQEQAIAYDPTPNFGGEGAHAEPDFADRAQRYGGKGVRSMVLDYRLDDFDWIAATAAALRRVRGIDTNAELVMALMKEAAAAAEL